MRARGSHAAYTCNNSNRDDINGRAHAAYFAQLLWAESEADDNRKNCLQNTEVGRKFSAGHNIIVIKKYIRIPLRRTLFPNRGNLPTRRPKIARHRDR